MGGNICRLCLEASELRNSHILPEFFYSSVYDDIHRTLLVPSNQKERLIQKGLREYLLCQKCETQLSRFEGYAAEIIKSVPGFLEDPGRKFIYSEAVDYRKFKLFQLSILWRASISKHPMFANVNLGKHEEKIRIMLDSEEPGRHTEYGCFMMRIPDTQKVDRIIMPPMPERLFRHNGVRFMTGNLFWYFIVSSHAVNKTVASMFLQETDMLRIWTAPWNEQEVVTNISKLFKSRKIRQ